MPALVETSDLAVERKRKRPVSETMGSSSREQADLLRVANEASRRALSEDSRQFVERSKQFEGE